MADFYVLTHRKLGPITTYATREEAEADLARVVRHEPSWRRTLSVEPFEFVVAELGGSREPSR